MGARGPAALLCVLCALCIAADKPPWRARRRPDVQHSRHAAERVRLEHWPAEPASPPDLDRERFARALRQLCGWMPRSRPAQYTAWIADYGEKFGIDPFLLGGLIYRESHCRADKQDLGGVGLSLLAPTMYQHGFRARRYHYRVREGEAWVERQLDLSRFPFFGGQLFRAEPNIYFTAGLLAAWKDQHETVDETFAQVPHRHYVSHWVWGDRVPSARAEDRILNDRRRLLEYYGARPPPAPLQFQGIALGSPLDGAPRVVSSGLGFARDGGDRSHRGIDIEAEFGEPVRAIAAGRVVFSGVDLPGQRNNESLPPQETNEYMRRALGRGGRYVCILHPSPTAPPLRSCYMHLETVEVPNGDDVKRGQLIGTVGRTGMKRSAPHLHLELHLPNELLDGLEVLAGHVVGEPTEFEE